MSPNRYLLKSCIENTQLESQSTGDDGKLIYKLNLSNDLQRVISINTYLCNVHIRN